MPERVGHGFGLGVHVQLGRVFLIFKEILNKSFAIARIDREVRSLIVR